MALFAVFVTVSLFTVLFVFILLKLPIWPKENILTLKDDLAKKEEEMLTVDEVYEMLAKMKEKEITLTEMMALPFEERQRLLAESVEAAQYEDFELLEAFGEEDFVE